MCPSWSRTLFAVGIVVLFLLEHQGASARRHREELSKEDHKIKGRWLFAETEELDRAQAQLPAGHPSLDDAYAIGLPQACITYEERYGKYKKSTLDMATLNEKKPDSEHVVLLRIHPGVYWCEDFVLNVRALAHEAHYAGWHLWLLQQDSLAPDSENHGSPATYLKQIPVEFRPLVVAFTAQQLHAEFPQAHLYREPTGMQADFKWREYMGATLFLERYSVYNFAFVVESDDRYTGADWGKFFNAVLHIAEGTIRNVSQDTDPYAKTLQQLSKAEAEQPDLILFATWLYGPDPATEESVMSGVEHWKLPNIIKHLTTMYGLSRRMHNAIVRHSRQGFGGFIEQFVPSVALHENVNTVSVSPGVWNDVHPLHCCLPEKTYAMYESWFLNGTCLASFPLHPVKNDDHAIWKPHNPH